MVPLLVPPPGFLQLSRDPAISARMHDRGSRFITEFRRTVHVRSGGVMLSGSVTITISSVTAYGLDAASYAAAVLAEMQRQTPLRVDASSAVSLCNGIQGWRIAAHDPSPSGESSDQVFAGVGDRLYTAALYYPTASGDYGAKRSLRTFCPPALPAVQPSPATPAPLSPAPSPTPSG